MNWFPVLKLLYFDLQKDLENHMKEMTERLKMLFKFAQGAAHVWDVHEIGLAKQERALQEKLEQCRQVHDNQNQVLCYKQLQQVLDTSMLRHTLFLNK